MSGLPLFLDVLFPALPYPPLADMKLTFELVSENGRSCESVRLSSFLNKLLP